MAPLASKFLKVDEVVISGISGVFPQCENVEEFKQSLLNGKSLIDDYGQWGKEITDIPTKIGYVKTLDRFDHAFFRVHRKLAEKMDVASRLLLEKSFEAIVDAGYNPEQLKGRNIGVFNGTASYEEKLDQSVGVDEFTLLGVPETFMTTRISYWLDINGPSITMDTACSSSLTALDYAYKSIQNGDCEAAIVCTTNIGLSPFLSRAFLSSGALSPNGISRPFDEQADGFVRAESVVVVFLQKLKDARRVYANIIHTKSNSDGFKNEGPSSPSGKSQQELYRKFYDEIDINPNLVSYVETHGTGTKVGDVVEMSGIDAVFCRKRNNPLKIGSVKSNMGHGEASSGLCSIVKMIISFETGLIPPTINFKKPNPKIEALHNGHIEVVAKLTPREGNLFAINSFGMGGTNSHVLLSPHKKEKKFHESNENERLPRLVTISGRTEEAVNVIRNDLKRHHTDVEYIRLLHEIFSEDISGHLYRGYAILKNENETTKQPKFFSGDKRPIWFIFSGTGSQWPSMATSLMEISIFAESIRKSHEVLKIKGVDLIRIVTENDPQIFENILNSLVGIAAIQIALCDILRAVDIKPDGMIGHSAGELACAYADGCVTAEQMILASYYRGLALLEAKFIPRTMATVGVGYNTLKDMVPPEIDIACHNSSNNCTVSGPTETVRGFIKDLQRKLIFAREVNTSNIAFHSRYIASVASKLRSYLSNVIPDPKPRSDKWVCTSALEHEWNTEKLKFSSAEYFVNNALNPVYFEESSRHIPENAITIEIAPHGLLQAILKRSLPSTTDNFSLTIRDQQNGAQYLLGVLGQLYEVGVVPKLGSLYPPVQFPVSRSTRMISPLIRWNHDETWPVPKTAKKNNVSGGRDINVSLQAKNNEYLKGHIIDQRNLYPAFGYLALVWETVAIMHETNYKKLSVVFESVRFERATNIAEQDHVQFHVSIQRVTGQFEITERGALVASGIVRVPDDIKKEKRHTPSFDDEGISDSNVIPNNRKDFYKELRLRGYHYSGLFKTVVHCNIKGTYGKTLWRENFVTFMDTMAQISILSVDTRELFIPTFIRKIVIDIEQHFEILKTLDKDNPEFPVHHYPNQSLICSGGIQLIDWKGTVIARKRDPAVPVLEKYQFVPYVSNEQMDLNTAIRLCIHIALENLSTLKVETVELLNQSSNEEIPPISASIANTFRDLPLVQAEVNVLRNFEPSTTTENPQGITIITKAELPKDRRYLIIVVSDIWNKADELDKIFDALKDGGFIIAEESVVQNQPVEDLGLNVCFSRIINDKSKILLLRKIIRKRSYDMPIKIDSTSSWLSKAQKALSSIENSDKKLLVYAEKDSCSGILGFFNCLRREEYGERTRCFFLMDEDTPDFSLQNVFFKNQLDRDLSHNIYKNGQWGSYRHLLLEPIDNVEVPHAYNTLDVRGDLSSLSWVEGPLTPKEHSSETPLIHVYYSALNFRDVMLASGRISPMDTAYSSRLCDAFHGVEFCGKDRSGIRYMGMSKSKSIANFIQDDILRLWKVPDHMTLEEASTIAAAYATVVYAFFIDMKLTKGCSVLIHAGSGSVGQAAINICIHYNCTIFVTVGTPEKVEFIKKTFPQIPERNIGNSRDTSFESLIMENTDGRGVDVVLNSLADDKLQSSLRCVARFGHFIEIGKFDMVKNNVIELAPFLKSVTFHSVQLDYLDMVKQKELLLHQTLQKLLDNGAIKPLSRIVFEKNQVEPAFRYMAAGKHIGKVVIRIRDEEKDIHAKPAPICLPARPRVLCHKINSYIIVGGLGGFGLELADWLVLRGARNLVLSSRKGLQSGYQSYKIMLWRSYGVNVAISNEDVTTETGVSKLLQIANDLGPVNGIFNLAVILKDGAFRTQTEESFAISAAPKAIATQHLDKLSRKMCPQLQYFVVFSSVSCGRGNLHQTNYGMSNSVMERICEARHADNLPALAIQWGAIGEVGLVSDFDEDNLDIVIGGTLQQKMTSCLKALDGFMKQSNPIVSSIIVAEKRHADSDVINTVANILGIKDLKSISLTWTVSELGMDSILAIELKQIIETEFDIGINPQDLKMMTFGKLYKLKEEKEKSSR